MQTGSVKFFNDEKGWGFIIPDEPGPDLYVNWRSCRDSYVPTQGDIVQFEIKQFPDGGRIAKHVDLAE